MKICDVTCKNIETEIKESGVCEVHRAGERHNLEDSTPGGLCAHAFHIAHPYVFTLQNKGWFTWVKKKEGVIAQCPHPKGLIMEIKPKEGDESKIIVKAMEKRECPKHSTEDVFEVNESIKLCPRLFDIAYACTSACTTDPEKPIELFCPNQDGVVFELSRID